MGLHVDIDKVFEDNLHKEGVQRKNKFIINTGDNMTAEEREQRIKQNQEKYGLTQKEINHLMLPTSKNQFKSDVKSRELVLTLEQISNPKNNFSIIEKLLHLNNLKHMAEDRLD